MNSNNTQIAISVARIMKAVFFPIIFSITMYVKPSKVNKFCKHKKAGVFQGDVVKPRETGVRRV